MSILGGIFGKNTAGSFDAPCRTKDIARKIPSIPLSIVVELYYIFTTVWGREDYTLFCDLVERHSLHFHHTDLLPAVVRGLQVVVEIHIFYRLQEH